MNPLKTFDTNKEKLNADQFLNYCKKVVQEKENYSKIVVKKAQQFIDDQIKNK